MESYDLQHFKDESKYMFYKMIENKCTQWYESERCTTKTKGTNRL